MIKKTKRSNKKPCTKIIKEKIWADNSVWTVQYGELKRPVGNPGKTDHLFRVVAEKIPYDALQKLKKDMVKKDLPRTGVYMALDSMGTPRYIGRGRIFSRLASRKKAHPLELAYFSFYIVTENKHEREIETLLIHMAGSLLEFNEKKKRTGIAHCSIKDYEAGTLFYERHRKKGKKS
jgi:hypothetical protein